MILLESFKQFFRTALLIVIFVFPFTFFCWGPAFRFAGPAIIYRLIFFVANRSEKFLFRQPADFPALPAS